MTPKMLKMQLPAGSVFRATGIDGWRHVDVIKDIYENKYVLIRDQICSGVFRWGIIDGSKSQKSNIQKTDNEKMGSKYHLHWFTSTDSILREESKWLRVILEISYRNFVWKGG